MTCWTKLALRGLGWAGAQRGGVSQDTPYLDLEGLLKVLWIDIGPRGFTHVTKIGSITRSSYELFNKEIASKKY